MPSKIRRQPEMQPTAQPPVDAGLSGVVLVSAVVVLVTVTAWLVLLIPAMPTDEVSDQLVALRDGMGCTAEGSSTPRSSTPRS